VGRHAECGFALRTKEKALAVRPTGLAAGIRAMHLDYHGDLWIGTDRQVFWVSAANRRTVRELGRCPLDWHYRGRAAPADH